MEFGWISNKLAQFWSRLWKNKKMAEYYDFKWENLPDIAILEVYKYLNDKERVTMALTCKRWAELFHTPCLWRVRHFDMGGYKSNYNGMRANKFVEKLGSYVKYLSISCSHPSYHTTKIFQKSLEDLLSSRLRNSCLVEFEMERLELDRFWKQESSRERFINYFVRFFKLQKHLRVFDMTAAQFSVSGGIRILEAVGSMSGGVMEEMFMEDFFPARTAIYQIDKFKHTLSRFTNLSYLAVNYNCLSDEVLDILSKNLVGLLKTLNIKVYRNDPHVHRISGHIWKQMVTGCPALSVIFWFDSVGHWSEIIPILAREIPVNDIHLWTGYDDDAEWGLSEIINHITDFYKDSLDAVSLELDNNHEIVDEALFRLICTCKRLTDISVNAVLLVTTIESILQMEEERKIHLHSLCITACGLTDSEWAEVTLIKERYASLVTERGLDLRISTDLVFDGM